MRKTCLAALIAALPFAVPPGAARAEDMKLSTEIGQKGLSAVEARLSDLLEPTEAERFALGGVRFLRTVEAALQMQAREGLYDPTGMVPFLRFGDRAAVAADPSRPLRPEAVRELFDGVVNGLNEARQPLGQLGATDFSVEINLQDLWFDVNEDGKRTPDEGLMQLFGPALMGWRWSERAPDAPAPVVHFDAADAAWLTAYCHLLQGLGDIIIAYDPTEPIRSVQDAKARMAALSSAPGSGDPQAYAYFATATDTAAIMIKALDQDPDKTRLHAARDHFLAMVADNRRFWDAVGRETDNDHEWLPNDRQTSALGLDLPPGTGAHWLKVLADMEAILKGERLIPYWRTGTGVGLNIANLFNDPRPVDLVDWIQGAGALPYLQQGTLADADAWAAFEDMTQGQAMLLTLYLN